jgi:antitoxin component YwqK of YwqJK toxin-antitoxin module
MSVKDIKMSNILRTACVIVVMFFCLPVIGQSLNQSGSKQEEIILKQGKRIKTYYSGGELLSVTDYDIHNKKHGEYLCYHKNGRLKLKASYNHGKRCGDWFGFSSDGELLDIINSDTTKTSRWNWYFIKNVKRLDIKGEKYTFSNAEGKILAKGRYKNGLKTRKWKFYYENGKLKSKGTYIENSREGRWKEYHNNGKLKTKAKFSNDVNDGNKKQYNSKGRYVLTFLFKDGIIDGKPFYKNRRDTLPDNAGELKDLYLTDKKGKVTSRYEYDNEIFLVIVTNNKIGRSIMLGFEDQLDSMFKISDVSVYNIVIVDYEIQKDIQKVKLIPKELTAFRL